jgi:hypothetical protein
VITKRKPIRYMVVPVALLALLVLSMTLGSVWHHHDANSSESTCPICHLSHQPIERPLASVRTPTLAPVGPRLESQEPDFTPARVTDRVPARAPPSA